MNNRVKSFLLSLSLLTLLPACSTSSLQSTRLDKAEDQIILAEQILARSSSPAARRVSRNNIGTADAYLATLNDFIKSLSSLERQRHKALQKRSAKVLRRINNG